MYNYTEEICTVKTGKKIVERAGKKIRFLVVNQSSFRNDYK